MNKYKVRVYAESFTTIEVEAENEDDAKVKAEGKCLYGYQSWSDGKTILNKSKILDSGPIDRPLVRCPSEWEVYSSMPGSKKINAAITRAALKCSEAMLARSKKQDIGPKLVQELAQRHIAPVFKKYAEFGTGDTEPRANVASYLSKYAKELGAEAHDEIYEAVRWNL